MINNGTRVFRNSCGRRYNLFDIEPSCLELADVIFDGERSILKSPRKTRDSTWAGESSSSVDSRADNTDRSSLGGRYSKPNIIFFLFNFKLINKNSMVGLQRATAVWMQSRVKMAMPPPCLFLSQRISEYPSVASSSLAIESSSQVSHNDNYNVWSLSCS